MNDWPHQIKAVNDVLAAVHEGRRRILLCSPTGGGKTRIATRLIERYGEIGGRAVVYTNRKMLVDQLSAVLSAAGIDHGIRAAGYTDDRNLRVQVASMPTENTRTLKSEKWEPHDADFVLVDEAHLQKGKVAAAILKRHHDAGAAYVGLSATPIDVADYYDTLITAGTLSELRACGALVLATHKGIEEPDYKALKKRPAVGEDLTEAQNQQLMGGIDKATKQPTPKLKRLVGSVLGSFAKFNPDRRPSILFAPGVPESLWFAEQFVAAGITAAHIDGETVWINGKLYRTSQQARADVLGGSKDGGITVLCNRFVLREGVDAPWLAHGIFACVFGSLQSYLQSGGRLLRAFPGLDKVTIQDHGGNWWRHGSLNADRHWDLSYTGRIVSGLREECIRRNLCRKCGGSMAGRKSPLCPACGFLNEREPLRCPECQTIIKGPACACGWIAGKKRSRPVVMADGTLREMAGDIFAPKKTQLKPNTQRLWTQVYFRAKNSSNRMTFNQALGLFVHENWYSPPYDLKLMPRNFEHWFRAVADVGAEDLT